MITAPRTDRANYEQNLIRAGDHFGSLYEFPLSAAKRTKLPVRFNYGSCSSRNVTGHSQRALSVLPIQTDRLFDKARRILHELRCL